MVNSNKKYSEGRRWALTLALASDPFFKGFAFLLVYPFGAWLFHKYYGYRCEWQVAKPLKNLKLCYRHVLTGAAHFLVWLAGQRLIGKGPEIPRRLRNETNLKGKTVLITGGTAGIGYNTAEQCALWEANTIITSRDKERGKMACFYLHEVSEILTIDELDLHLDDLESVKRCANKIISSNMQIDVLVLNAGTVATKPTATRQGFEKHFGVNHLGHFFLVYLLLPQLIKWNTRVIVVSSYLHWYALGDNISQMFDEDIDIDKLKKSSSYDITKLYGISKLANLLFAQKLQRLFARSDTDAICVSLHPGVVRTEIYRDVEYKEMMNILYGITKTSKEGAKTTNYLIAAPLEDLMPGGYYTDCHLGRAAPEAYDIELADYLWEKSISLVTPYI